MEKTKNILKVVYCVLALLFFRWIFSIAGLPESIRSIMSTIVYLIFWGFLIKYAIRLIKIKPKVQSQGINMDHGSARWANYADFMRANNPEGGNSGLVLGVSGLLRSKPGHLITVAGTGSGKGACLIIPSLLNQPSGSYVVTDPKGENAYITARSQKEYGQNVVILDPWDEQTKIGATHGIPAAGFNPFDFIKMD
ncbi:MAG: type IV secretory system conjugative DNA transfer family protein, partial [Chitinophagaceae bacterium]|nr:type IV secretory system conjugative DNA transfer family protein [Chitinophagaceae bacterium]